jgi:hypothetical protein
MPSMRVEQISNGQNEGLRNSQPSPAELLRKQPQDDLFQATQRYPGLLTLQRIQDSYIKMSSPLCLYSVL